MSTGTSSEGLGFRYALACGINSSKSARLRNRISVEYSDWARDPVVLHGVEHFLLPKQRVDLHGVAAKHMDPVDALETVGQFLRPPDVTQLQERIVELRVFDTVTVELPGQPETETRFAA